MLRKFIGNRRTLIIACLLASVTILPITFLGIPRSNDLPQHFQFAQVFYDSLTIGGGFPGWADKINYGYGDIGVRFYPPFAYYVLAAAKILAGNWYDAAWLTFMLWMIVGGVGVYSWARCWFAPQEASLAALIYLLVPSHLAQPYIDFNNYSEFAAASLLPFCFAFLHRTTARANPLDIICLGFAYALLILTHLPLALIGSLSLFVYWTTLARKKNLFRSLSKFALGIGLGLAASAFYWVRMISEMKWLNHAADRFSSGHYSFANQFFPFYLYAPENETAGVLIYADIAVALSFLFLLSPIIFLIYRRRGESGAAKAIFKTVLPVGAFAFFMVTPLSRPLWEILAPLQKIQFPARWMVIAAMCGALTTTATIQFLRKNDLLKQRILAHGSFAALLLVLIFNCIYIFNPSSFMPIERTQFEVKINNLSDAESFNCWWTIWAQPKALETKEKVLAGARQIEIVSWQPEERIFRVADGAAIEARVATFYFPYWKAEANGESLEVGKDENGVLLIGLPDGKANVKIYFQEPLINKIANFVSIFSVFFLVLAGAYLGWRKFAAAPPLK